MMAESIVLIITSIGAIITGIIFALRRVSMSKCMGGTCIQKVSGPRKKENDELNELRKIPSVRNNLTLLDSSTLHKDNVPIESPDLSQSYFASATASASPVRIHRRNRSTSDLRNIIFEI